MSEFDIEQLKSFLDETPRDYVVSGRTDRVFTHPASISDTSEKSNENMEKTYKDSLSINQALNQAQSEFNSTMAKSILEVAEFGTLTKNSAGTITKLSNELSTYSEGIKTLALTSLGLKNVTTKGTTPNPTSPGTSVQSNESNKALMSAKMTIEGKSQMDINIKSTLPEDFQKQIQGQLQTMLPSIIDARVKEILDNQGYSK